MRQSIQWKVDARIDSEADFACTDVLPFLDSPSTIPQHPFSTFLYAPIIIRSTTISWGQLTDSFMGR
jgi:hypothetical protein